VAERLGQKMGRHEIAILPFTEFRNKTEFSDLVVNKSLINPPICAMKGSPGAMAPSLLKGEQDFKYLRIQENEDS
jgi:hypothetical protein